MINVKEILQLMYSATSGVCSKRFLMERPESVETKVNDFLVLSLPHVIEDMEINQDGEYGYYNTTAEFDIFVRDNSKTNNPNNIDIAVMNTKVQALLRLFPIVVKGKLLITSPRITLTTKDGHGFHATLIQANLTTLV